MKKVLVTGSNGFIGKNLVLTLKQRRDIEVLEHDVESPCGNLESALSVADVLVHLAGVNRPKDVAEFQSGNATFTSDIVQTLSDCGNRPLVIAASSRQAALDNPYGVSKRNAEIALAGFAERTGAPVFIFRLTNVFGKMCRPYYNSVVATFCHQATHGESFRIDDPARMMELVYIDDVVRAFTRIIDGEHLKTGKEYLSVEPSFFIGLGELAAKIHSFREKRGTGLIPDFGNLLDKYLYSTFLSYLDAHELAYSAEKRSDQRGYLFEMVKSEHAGQVFVSRTLPGITRGNHFHDTKVEKFVVIDGRAKIALRHTVSNDSVEYVVTGEECKIVDIPPGWTHSITNIGSTDLITVFWANEIFDAAHADTFACEV